MEQSKRCPACNKQMPSGMAFCPWDGQALAPAPSSKTRDPLLDAQAGDYVIQEVIGSGGMGMVYRAIQPLIGKKVAIKVLKAEFAGAQELVQRLLVEARAVNAIQHRGIIDIFGFGELPDGRPYVVMELLHGRPLDVFIWERKQVPVNEAVIILDEILAALGAAHRVGIVHRDLKPGNVFLQEQEDGGLHVKLLDFGIAKVTENRSDGPKTVFGHILGTPEYMAPEQIRGKKAEPVTDLYSVGVIAFQMITGRLPFTGEPTQVLFAQVEDEPPALSSLVPELPMEIEVLVQRLLAKDPARRLPSAEVVRKELEPFLPKKSPSKEFVRSDSGRIHSPTAILTPATPASGKLPPRESFDSKTELLAAPEPLKPKRSFKAVGAAVAIGVLALAGVGAVVLRKGPGVPPPSPPPAAAVQPAPAVAPGPPKDEPPAAEASPAPQQHEEVPPSQELAKKEEAAPPAPLAEPEAASQETPARAEPEAALTATAKPEPQEKRKTKGTARIARKPPEPVPVQLVLAPPPVQPAVQPAPAPPSRKVLLQACYSIKQLDRRTQQQELLQARIVCLLARSKLDNGGQADIMLVRDLAKLREASDAAKSAGDRMKVTLQLDEVQARYDQRHGRLVLE